MAAEGTDGEASGVHGLLRELREEACNLQHLAEEVVSAAADGRETARRSAREALDDVKDHNAAEIQERLDKLRAEVRSSPGLRADYGEIETRLQNAWDLAVRRLQALDRDKVTTYRDFADHLDPIILEALYVTVPPRVRSNLVSYRVGAAMDFRSDFSDEAKKPEHQEAVFDWMYRHGAAIAGVFDRERLVIFKASASPWRRAATLVAILAVVLGLGALPFLRAPLDLMDDLGPDLGDRQLAMAYFTALAGALLHLFVEQFKDGMRAARAGEPHATLGNWALWLHVRYGSIILSAFSVFVVAMVVAGTTEPQLLTMLAVGYSADSLLDLVLPKVSTLMTKRSEVISKELATP
jgi:hypothetical protein